MTLTRQFLPGQREEWVRRGSAGDLPGLDAARAHAEALGGPVHRGADALDVRVEPTLRDLARPRTVVAEVGRLGAEVTDGSHRKLLKTCTSAETCCQQGGQPEKTNRAPVEDANRQTLPLGSGAMEAPTSGTIQ